MKRKFLSIFLSLALVLSLIPAFGITASAENQSLTSETWSLDGNYILNDDVTLNFPIRIDGGKTATIDLNGHVLKCSTDNSIIVNYGTLIIKDSNSQNLSHRFSVTKSGLWTLDETNGTEVLTGGVITGGRGDEIYDTLQTKFGGAICNNGILTIEGGNIVGNTADNGGAIYLGIDSNGMTMKGGTICGNVTSKSGAGVYVHQGSTFTMESGKISNNAITDPKEGGGGVFVRGTFIMKNGEISSNKVNRSGAGVYVYYNDSTPGTPVDGTFTMDGGFIKNNTAGYMGGGVYVDDHAKVVISGAVTGNKAGNFGGGVFTKSDTTIKGKASIKDNTTDTTIVSGDFAVVDGHPIKVDNFTGDVIDVTVVYKNGSNYELTEGTIVENTTADVAKKFRSDYNNQFRVRYDSSSKNLNFVAYTPPEAKYLAIGNTVYAMFTDSKGESQMLSLQLIAGNCEYSGSPYAGVSLDTKAWLDADLEEPTIMYKGRLSTKYSESSTPPTDAGKYTAFITIQEKYVAKANFEIVKSDDLLKNSKLKSPIKKVTDTTTLIRNNLAKFILNIKK